MRYLFATTLALGGLASRAWPQEAATVREYQRTFPTYPFSDPNPIPVVGRIYPYFRFDGFAHQATPRSWQVIELANDYISVMIMPEIGGKIWTATVKSTGKPFLYFNQAVKFRDIAMRGPWTSGGIEANYGIIGHTPNVATPVDYITRRNQDGSVSCVIGALDLLTETPWRLEIRLAANQAFFTTSSFWYNASPLEQPYYTWMNAGIKAAGNLQFIYPGTNYLGHAGEHASWPINQTNGKDISWYENNAFGGYKSYHVFGRATDFFGAYWHDEDFGMVRYAPRDDKPGKKIWIWGLSRQGMIWENLLTDTDGQYVEVQSGRLFNQSAEQSTFTPFKHRGFTPHTADRWTESWYPVLGIKGFVAASQAGALNLTRRAGWLVVALSPAEPINDSLTVVAGSTRIGGWVVRRRPLETFVDSLRIPDADVAKIEVRLGEDRLVYRADSGQADLARPLDAPSDFDWRSGYGFYLQGKEWLRQREYQSATAYLDSALIREPHFVPALADRAGLAIRAGLYQDARQLALRALAIDTYDGATNYYYGLANRWLGNVADAKDGFEVASAAPEFRGAAWTELARLWLAEGNLTRASEYGEKALGVDEGNLDALGVLAVAARRRSDRAGHAARVSRLEAADPLSQLARFERLLDAGDPHTGAKLRTGVRSELPEQTLLDLAAWYLDVADSVVATTVLEAIGDQPEALYWRAALGGQAGAGLVDRANQLSPRLVFPFRPAVLAALQRAMVTTESWKPRYYLALGRWAQGRVVEATRLFDEVANRAEYAAFYAARASLPGRDRERVLTDLRRAMALDSSEWRYPKLLAERLREAGDAAGAVSVGRLAVGRFPNNYILGLTLAKAELAAGEFVAANQRLDRLVVLPYEGAAEARGLYQEAKLQLASDALTSRQWATAAKLIAAAREWPERLGAGKPYPADTDERLEDWLLADLLSQTRQVDRARAIWIRLAGDTRRTNTASDVLPLWAQSRLGRGDDVAERVARWQQDPTRAGLVQWARRPDQTVTGPSDGFVLARWFARVAIKPAVAWR